MVRAATRLPPVADGGACCSSAGTLGLAAWRAVAWSGGWPARRARLDAVAHATAQRAAAPRPACPRRLPPCRPWLQGLGLHLARPPAAACRPWPRMAPPRLPATRTQRLTRAAAPRPRASPRRSRRRGRARRPRPCPPPSRSRRPLLPPSRATRCWRRSGRRTSVRARARSAGLAELAHQACIRRDRRRAAAQDAAEPLREVAEVRPHPAPAPRAHQAPQGAVAAAAKPWRSRHAQPASRRFRPRSTSSPRCWTRTSVRAARCAQASRLNRS